MKNRYCVIYDDAETGEQAHFSSHGTAYYAWVNMNAAIKRGYKNVHVIKDKKQVLFDAKGEEIDGEQSHENSARTD